MGLNAKYDAVIVKPIEAEESTYGNIIVPDIGKEKNETGEVVAIGPGKPSIMTGEIIPTTTKIGEVVILPTMGFTKFSYKGDDYYIGKEQELLANITKDE